MAQQLGFNESHTRDREKVIEEWQARKTTEATDRDSGYVSKLSSTATALFRNDSSLGPSIPTSRLMRNAVTHAPLSDPISPRRQGSTGSNVTVSLASVHAPVSRCRHARDEQYHINIEVDSCMGCRASKAHYLATNANSICEQDLFEKVLSIPNKNPVDIDHNTPFHFLASLGPKRGRIQTLKDAGGDIRSKNINGNTFLHVLEPSRLEGSSLSDLLAWCSKNGLDLKQRNLDGQTFLHCLLDQKLSYNHWENVLTALGKHLPVREKARPPLADHLLARDNKGTAILDIVRDTTHPPYLEAVAPLIPLAQLWHFAGYTDTSPGSWNGHCAQSGGPLTSEELQGRDAIMRCIVSRSAEDPSITHRRSGMNALSCLAYIVRPCPENEADDQTFSVRGEQLKECLENDVDPNDYDRFGSAPLHHFLSHPRVKERDDQTAEMIALLVRKGADVNMRNKMGESPLHIACKNGRVSCVEKLIKLKADVWARDYKDLSIIDSAKSWMVGFPDTRPHIQECIDLISSKMVIQENDSGSILAKTVPNNISFLW